MQGTPRKKRPTDYLQFKPYRAIVAPQLSKYRPEGPLSSALKSGLIVALVLSIPVLLVVVVATYFTSDFVNAENFASNAIRNLLLPALGVLVVAFCSGIFSLFRR